MPRYIDADALKDVIQQNDYLLADRLNSIDNGMFTIGIFQAIDQMPTLSPDDLRHVVRGEWKDMGDFESCSACGATHLKEIDTVYGKETWLRSNYCPNCGAKMKGVEDKS